MDTPLDASHPLNATISGAVRALDRLGTGVWVMSGSLQDGCDDLSDGQLLRNLSWQPTYLYDGSKQESDACRRPHGQRPPEGNTYCARDDTCAARACGQRAQKCKEQR